MTEHTQISTDASTQVDADLTAHHATTETPSAPEHRSSHLSTSPQLGGLNSRTPLSNNAPMHKIEDLGNAGKQLTGAANHDMNGSMAAMMQMQAEAAQRTMAVKVFESALDFEKDLVGAFSRASQKIQ